MLEEALLTHLFKGYLLAPDMNDANVFLRVKEELFTKI